MLLKSFSLILLCALGTGVFAGSSLKQVDGVAAIIGDSVILNSEVDAYTVSRLNSAGKSSDSVDLPKYRKLFLNDLINGKILIVHAAKDTNIKVSESDIDLAQNNQIQMILKQNNITLAGLEQELNTRYGMTLAKFKAQMRSQAQEQLIRQSVQRQYVSAVQVSRQDVETFYNTYKDSLPRMGESVLLSKIIMTVTQSDSVRQAAYAKISDIKKRLDKGEDFAEVAKKYSEDPNAQNGGDLGFIQKGTLTEIKFEQRAFQLSPGQVSDIFESRMGFHIIRVTEKKDQSVHVYQIFVRVAPSESQIQRVIGTLDSVKAHCTSSQDFITAVKKLSTDNLSRTNNGRAGWYMLTELPDTLRNAFDSLVVGRISSPVKDGNDITIYRVDERVTQRMLSIDDDYSFLADKAQELRAQQKLFDLVKKWRQDIFVQERY